MTSEQTKAQQWGCPRLVGLSGLQVQYVGKHHRDWAKIGVQWTINGILRITVNKKCKYLKKKRWKKDSILTVAYKSLYKKQYGNQRIPASLWQFFFLRGFRKLANVLKIWQKMKTICHEFLGGCCYRLWNQFELRNTGYFTTNPPS